MSAAVRSSRGSSVRPHQRQDDQASHRGGQPTANEPPAGPAGHTGETAELPRDPRKGADSVVAKVFAASRARMNMALAERRTRPPGGRPARAVRAHGGRGLEARPVVVPEGLARLATVLVGLGKERLVTLRAERTRDGIDHAVRGFGGAVDRQRVRRCRRNGVNPALPVQAAVGMLRVVALGRRGRVRLLRGAREDEAQPGPVGVRRRASACGAPALGVTGPVYAPPLPHPAPVEGDAKEVGARPRHCAHSPEGRAPTVADDEHVGRRRRCGGDRGPLLLFTKRRENLGLDLRGQGRDGPLDNLRRSRATTSPTESDHRRARTRRRKAGIAVGPFNRHAMDT